MRIFVIRYLENSLQVISINIIMKFSGRIENHELTVYGFAINFVE